MTMKDYQVIVGNVGTVYAGPDIKTARSTFAEYRGQSADGYGRAASESVTMMDGGEIVKEFRPSLVLPSIKDLSALIRELKKDICADYRAYDDDDEAGMLLTIGCSYGKGWSYQTGDNSFTGGAYGHPFWGVGAIRKNSNSRELAKEIIADCQEQTW